MFNIYADDIYYDPKDDKEEVKQEKVEPKTNTKQEADVTTVTATDSDISENLDLEVVASVFAEAKDLEDFEKTLNDPDKKISNLDLNEDGDVDYLRVVETSKGNTHLVTIQAVLGDDKYQDIATIDVEKGSKSDETQVQVVGDVYLYGPEYIITPVYVHPPVIFVWFWGPVYHPWHSPYYWGHYPPHYHPYYPRPVPYYRRDVRVNVNINHTYRHTTVRNSHTARELQNNSRRNDYGSRNPNNSYEKRNAASQTRSVTRSSNASDKSTTNRSVDKSTRSSSERNTNSSSRTKEGSSTNRSSNVTNSSKGEFKSDRSTKIRSTNRSTNKSVKRRR